MTIPVPTFGHTPLVGGNFENGYDEATTNIQGSYLGRRFEKTLLICSHGPVGRVPGLTEARLQQQSTRENFAFTSFSKLFWNFASFFL